MAVLGHDCTITHSTAQQRDTVEPVCTFALKSSAQLKGTEETNKIGKASFNLKELTLMAYIFIFEILRNVYVSSPE
jgi:hypothetical protein